MKNNNTSNHFTAEQGILPMFPSEILNVDDPVLMYDRFMEEIDLKSTFVTYRRVALADPGIIPSTC